jgi:hypothetical protein
MFDLRISENQCGLVVPNGSSSASLRLERSGREHSEYPIHSRAETQRRRVSEGRQKGAVTEGTETEEGSETRNMKPLMRADER